MVMSEDFLVKDCALIAIATGDEAQNLRELRDIIQKTHPGCLYYHFWGGLLRTRFDDPEFQNDFAIWAWRSLHDAKLAEQLSLIDPNVFDDLESLRRELIELIEQRLYEWDHVPWTRPGEQFEFIRSQIVIFDSGIRLKDPPEMAKFLPRMSLSSLFYHFIDARRRPRINRSDFSMWLDSCGGAYPDLARLIDEIDPYFTTLTDLRQEINAVFQRFLVGGA